MSTAVTRVADLPKGGDVATPHERADGKPAPVEWKNIDNIGPAGLQLHPGQVQLHLDLVGHTLEVVPRLGRLLVVAHRDKVRHAGASGK